MRKKKKKITKKKSHKSCLWHFRKTAKKIHNKEYIYIYIQHIYVYICVYIYTVEP